MTERIIIENRTTMPMEYVLEHVRQVLAKGRISDDNTQYCYHTSFANGIGVAAFKNKCSDRFVVFKDGVDVAN